MTRDEFIQLLSRFVGLDLVKSFRSSSPTSYSYEVYADPKEKKRTQIIHVFLTDDEKDVIAYSEIGKYPSDSNTLIELLKENFVGYYSRLCIFKDALVQVYRYPLKQLEFEELTIALYEVALFADIIEKNYFGGVDEG